MYTEHDIKHGFNPAVLKRERRRDKVDIFLTFIVLFSFFAVFGKFLD